MASPSTNSDSPPTPPSDLTNLVRYAGRINNWTAGQSLSHYRENTLLNDAVERNYIEIGNILRRLENSAPELHRQLPQAQSWYAFRIILVHLRWRIDPDIVWRTTQNDLPILLNAAANLLPRGQN